MPLSENFRVDLLLIITALSFFIFSTGKAGPAPFFVPPVIIAPS